MQKLLIPFMILLATTPVLAETTPVDQAQVIMTVNAVDITVDDILAYGRIRIGEPLPKDPVQAQSQLLNEIITTVALSKEMEKTDFADPVETRAAIKMSRLVILRDLAVELIMEKQEIQDDEIESLYKLLYPQKTAKTEYKARHILVEKEEKAKDLLKEINSGADFAELAKEFSTGPSGKKGGDLGWISADVVVPPFSRAMKALQKGQHSTTPVNTEFGWHIILLEDTRELPAIMPPPLEQVRAEIINQLKTEKMRDVVRKLRQASEVSSPQARKAKEELKEEAK